MNIAWLSSNMFGYKLLTYTLTLDKINIETIITLSNKSKTLMYDHIDKDSWNIFNIPCHYIEDINKQNDFIDEYDIDYVFVAGWRQIINKELLDKHVFVGFHPTLLPYGRGNAPIINQILDGTRNSASTLFYLSDGIDDGDIIEQVPFIIEKDDYALDVYNKFINASMHTMYKINNDGLNRIKQCGEPTYFKNPRDKQEIHDNDDVDTIYRKIRAFSYPYDGAYLVRNNKRIVIWTANIDS